MKITLMEMETNILTNKKADEWDLWTFDPAWEKKLRKLGYEPKPDHQGGWSCSIPKNRISIRRREKRQVSEKTLAALKTSRERLKQAQQISCSSDQNPKDVV